MSDESLSGLLRRAAVRVEDMASGATPGPWRTAMVEGIFYIASAAHGPVTMDNENPVGRSIADDEGVAVEEDGAAGRADADWMVALNPLVAAPLSGLLRAIADDAEAVDRQNAAARERALRRNDDGQTFVVHRAEVGWAVQLARAVLGETEAPDAR